MIFTNRGQPGKFLPWFHQSRRNCPCLALENMCPIRQKGSGELKTCPNLITKIGREIASRHPVRFVVAVRREDVPERENYTILGIAKQAAPSSLSFFFPFIGASIVENISVWTFPTSPRPARFTPNGSSISPCELSSRTACLIAMRVGICGVTIACLCRFPRFKNGLKRQEKKIRAKIESNEYFNWAFENFSGYIAVDEVYDGPFCVLSIVDNREYKRLTYRVLDHDPKHEDIRELFRSFQSILKDRKLELRGITTDGSQLYPGPIAEIFPGIRHQICEFHVKMEINKGILKAVAKVRRELEKTKVKRNKRGRPTTKEDKATIRKNERIQAKIGALFEHRYLFVQKTLTSAERKKFLEITKGLPELRKLREIMDEVYRLYDRRCRTQTALEKLRQLRLRVKRFKLLSASLAKLDSPTLEKSLEFLDDKLLPSTSNAVERGNRRHRKMQKSVYRVRTHRHVENRIALDMFRDLRLTLRKTTTATLHYARCG